MDMRVGTIIEASKMPKANKLLKIDTGIDAPSFQELPRVLNRKIL
jgi:tRNA-binding EMAP/Myf-like protein